MQPSQKVTAKKHLGQHFLNDEQIAVNIVNALAEKCETNVVIEIGPGMGVLTKYLLQKPFDLYAIDVDAESVAYLKQHYPQLEPRLTEGDFLKIDPASISGQQLSIIGNFPYNISSQIVFRILEYRQQIPLMAGMFQKEVAERICSGPGNKDYGILSVLAQTYYTCEYLFTVPEHVFTPPPKVKSGVMRMIRKPDLSPVNEKMLFKVVKAAFNQRRKKLRNAIAQFHVEDAILQEAGFADKRAEQLGISDFINLTNLVIEHGTNSH
jgi:16S rRNA (adenine1518-N6/adenine1519-N6)-dimethyltransferase